MEKKVTKAQIEAIVNAHEASVGTTNYAKYEMCLEYKYLRDGKWTSWKYVAWTVPTVGVNNKYYFKTVRGKLYIMRDCFDNVERYEVTPAVKELLNI